jgi:hypothetical protein
MYFSQNITYHYETIDKKRPELGRHFVTLEQIRLIEESNKRKEQNEQRKAAEEEQQKLFQFLSENFSEEELEFLSKNWEIPE